MPDKTLFFALWLSDRQHEKTCDSFGPALSTVKGTSADCRNWHIRLVCIANYPEEKIPGLLSAAEINEYIEIWLRFDTLTFWQRPKIACLHARTVPPSLTHLVQSLQQALIPFGHAPDPRIYQPHITMSRKVRSF